MMQDNNKELIKQEWRISDRFISEDTSRGGMVYVGIDGRFDIPVYFHPTAGSIKTIQEAEKIANKIIEKLNEN